MNTTIRLVLIGTLLFTSTNLIAQPWNFSEPVNVSATAKQGVFHHLESSGRRNIAVSGNVVGITWEDDSDGTPRVYFARKTLNSKKFDPKIRISAQGEAYEPSIIALGDGQFVIAWEEDERISTRIVAPHTLGPIIKYGDKTSVQASLVNIDDRILLVHREQTQRFGQIILQELKINNQLYLSTVRSCHVDLEPLKNDQLYPVIALLDNSVNVAWEDRRLGYTVIMYSQSNRVDICKFTSPVRISDQPPGPKSAYGSGHGVARVTLKGYSLPGLTSGISGKVMIFTVPVSWVIRYLDPMSVFRMILVLTTVNGMPRHQVNRAGN